jgi:hypothetical protein
MGVPTSEVGYTAAMPRREDDEVHKDMWWHWTPPHKKNPQRLSWFGHVQRMPDTRTVKKTFEWNLLTKSSQGRPKYRWEVNVKQDICQMKVKNWITCVQDRGIWKDVVEKAITCKH